MERIQRKSDVSDAQVQAKPGAAFPVTADGGPGGIPGGVPPQLQARAQSPGAWNADDGLMAAMGLGVQLRGEGDGDSGGVHRAAAHGVSGTSTGLPHLDQIQKSFGASHDVSGVSAHVGGPAAQACDAIGASAYATGNSVAFKSSPDLHTAAHEAAHVVQQKQGISLYGGVGEAGDVHERHADAVADRVVAGESAADLLSAGSSGGAMSSGVQRQVQRKDGDPKPAGAEGPAKPADGAAPDAAGGGGGGAASTGPKTASVLLSAIYEEVPGEAKDKVRRAKENEAVWLSPLGIYSNFPQEKRSQKHYGVVAGGGQKTVDEFQAPISEGTSANGRGSITAQLKYASDTSKSFNVTVDGVKKTEVAGAEKQARKIVEREISTLGDVEDVAKIAEGELNQNDKWKGAKVSISVKDAKTQQEGSTTFNYKVRTAAGIRMDLLAQPVGEKVVKSGGSKTVETGREDENNTKAKDSKDSEQIQREDKDKYKKTDTSTETQDVDYYEKVAQTLDDYVKKTTEVRSTLTSKLAEETVNHKHSTWGEDWVEDNETGNHQDYTKDSKHTVETGERDKENWAAKLQKGVGIVKDLTTIPFVDKIPGLGWFSRKVKGWQLDLIDKGLGIFAEKGKVKFTDTNLDEKVGTKGGSTDHTEGKDHVELTEDQKKEYSRKLNEEFQSSVKDDWERHMKDITETSKTYRSKIKKDSQTDIDKTHTEDYKRDQKKGETENEQKHKERQNQTTVATFESTSTWKFSKPLVKATVVSGDAEVKAGSEPFGPEPGEVAPGAATK
ncbi:MAG TPA: DUF4157 domain-containing protein [Kofleriaceae bacterium]|nr:DUF4157 domain-containing protein [Kofleriaceae bacterium]